ncbi:ATP-grasp domain-containing protein [Winogradskya humida]|uniref:ATP-grasp domain-containing protein n=1 Tax=Winogradskya humida TaxID=113566 RepID=A0ABQ3ZGV2_9ACTN|nr:ATP-grasp domain-containing protein [Actinoplanes humidus]GIE17801.1 hypothetical protein Ahu01nite_009030 [Actinoplanes humidus]
MTDNDPRPRLLLVASGWQPFREYLLASIAGSFRVHLFHTTEPAWEQQYLTGWTVLPSTIDGPAMADAALPLHGDSPFAGVLCWDEGRIHATSFIAQALGLPNGDPDVLWRLRDKAQTRAALAGTGVAQPRSVPVRDLPGALAAAESVGYPAILKPRGLGASLGVVRIDNAAELRSRFAFTRDTTAPDPVHYSTDDPVLVEQCVTGEEISVDAVIQAGVVTPLFIGRKVVGFPPYAEEVGHFVDARDPLLSDERFILVLQEAHTALGFRDGWTHTEFMLTADGPSLIEVNGRLGGDLIPYLGLLATGIDPGTIAAQAACGLPLELGSDRHQVAGVRFFYVDEEDTTLGAIGFQEAALPPSINRAAPIAAVGAVVSPPPKGTVWGRIAYAVATGPTRASCETALDCAGEALEYKLA